MTEKSAKITNYQQITDEKVKNYVNNVLSGELVSNKWIKLACKRFVKDFDNPSIFYDESSAFHVCDFFEKYLKHSKGEWAGSFVILEPWERFILSNIFGWKNVSNGFRRFRTAYIETARKNGKMLDLKTPVPTPNGWTTIGEIKLGDALFDEKGNVCEVTLISDIDYSPESYLMEFSNGEKIKACKDHLWLTNARVNTVGNGRRIRKRRKGVPTITITKQGYAHANLYRKQVYIGKADDPQLEEKFEKIKNEDLEKTPLTTEIYNRVRTTEEIKNTLVYGARKDFNHSIKLPEPLRLPFRGVLPIHAYVLGLWLGDGNSNGFRITCHKDDFPYYEKTIAECGYSIVHEYRYADRNIVTFSVGNYFPNLNDLLRTLNLWKNKHIPQSYLRGSYAERVALLKGLMDTDGSISTSGYQLTFCNKNKILIDGFMELLSTFGIKSNYRIKRIKGEEYYEVAFCTFIDDVECFALPRKLLKMKGSNTRTMASRSKTVQIKSITKCAPVPMRCIQVNSESHLFLVGRTMIPTHNTTLLAGIGNYLFIADGEPGAEIYTAATKRDQAKISHDEAKRMLKASPVLSKRVKIYKDNFSIHETACKFEPLGADADTLDGLNIHAALIDELHAHKNRNLWDVVETATGSRRQPLQIAITTAGFDRDTICFMIHDYVEKILEDVIDDDSFFGIIYGIDLEDKKNWLDEKVWIKANPNLGVSVKLEDLQRKAKRAKEMPSQLNAFLQKHLDVWTEAAEIWIPLENWDECFRDMDESELKDKECYMGLDLSSRNDITGLSLVFPGDPMRAIFRFFIPQDNMQERVRRDRVPYDAWFRQGYIHATRGNVIDYDFVLNQIMEDCKNFKVMSLYYDIYGATRFSQDLRNLGFEDPKENKHAERHLVEVSSTYNNYTYPMKELEKMIYGKQIELQKTPVMRWMASNIVLRMGPTGGIMPDKAKSRDKIDGVVSLCLGLMRALVSEPQPEAMISFV